MRTRTFPTQSRCAIVDVARREDRLLDQIASLYRAQRAVLLLCKSAEDEPALSAFASEVELALVTEPV